ncbi:MAG TPA: hypothetical protein VF170_14305, partial [Planctomycetaceae bacterium]
GSRLATASRDKTAKVFDLATGESLATFTGHEETVLGVLFAPDGQQVVSCGKDGQVRIWSVVDAKQRRNHGVGGEALSLAPAGSDAFLCGSGDRTARLYGFDGSERKSYGEHPDWVYAVAATADGKTIVAGSYDGTVTLHDAESGEVIRRFPAMPPKP